MKSARGAMAPLFGIMFAAGLLRVAAATQYSFFIDDAFSYGLASHSFREILRGAMSESNPPLPMFLFHFWQMGGKSEIYLRMLPVLLSVATVPLVYRLGRRMSGEATSLAAAALFAFGAGMVGYSTVYRYPALLMFLGAAAPLLYFRATEGSDAYSVKSLVPLALVEMAGLYTHYFFIFIFLGLNTVFLVDVARKRVSHGSAVRWIVSQIVVAASFAPWALAFRAQASSELAPVPFPDLMRHLAQLPFGTIPRVFLDYHIGPAFMWNPTLMTAITGIPVAAALLFFVSRRDASRTDGLRAFFVLIVALVVPCLMMLFLGLRLQTMYFCGVAPLYFAIAADGLCAKPSFIKKAALALMLCVSVVSSVGVVMTAKPGIHDNKEAIRIILRDHKPGDIVVVNPTYQSSLFNYYDTQKRLKLFGVPEDFDILRYNFNDISQVGDSRLRELSRLTGDSGRVWAFMGFGTKTKPDADERTISFLRANYRIARDIPFAPISFAGPVGRLFLFVPKKIDSTDKEAEKSR